MSYEKISAAEAIRGSVSSLVGLTDRLTDNYKDKISGSKGTVAGVNSELIKNILDQRGGVVR